MEKLIVTSSPHVKSSTTTSTIMRDVIIALIPALIASNIIFGLRAGLVTAVCVASCVGFEYLSRRIMNKKNTISDLSAVVTGIILAFNLPSTMPLCFRGKSFSTNFRWRIILRSNLYGN